MCHKSSFNDASSIAGVDCSIQSATCSVRADVLAPSLISCSSSLANSGGHWSRSHRNRLEDMILMGNAGKVCCWWVWHVD